MEEQELFNSEELESTEETTSSVSPETVENTVEYIEHDDAHHGPFYAQPEFAIAISFFLVIALLAKPVAKLGKAMMLKRIEDIKTRINDADQLKKDAEKLYVEYEKKYENADKEANDILAKNQKEIDFIKKENLDKLEKEVKIKEKDAEVRINSTKERAVQEVISSSVSLALDAVKISISKKLDSKTQDKLIDESINLISKIKA